MVCGQGGCGACTVVMENRTPSGNVEYLPVNACLRPLGLCGNRKFYTIEGLNGERAKFVPKSCQSTNGADAGCGGQGSCAKGVVPMDCSTGTASVPSCTKGDASTGNGHANNLLPDPRKVLAEFNGTQVKHLSYI